jgi:hypothetical protein
MIVSGIENENGNATQSERNPNAFRSNFFEYLFNTAAGRALPGPVNSSLKRMKLGNRLTIAATRKDNE